MPKISTEELQHMRERLNKNNLRGNNLHDLVEQVVEMRCDYTRLLDSVQQNPTTAEVVAKLNTKHAQDISELLLEQQRKDKLIEEQNTSFVSQYVYPGMLNRVQQVQQENEILREELAICAEGNEQWRERNEALNQKNEEQQATIEALAAEARNSLAERETLRQELSEREELLQGNGSGYSVSYINSVIAVNEALKATLRTKWSGYQNERAEVIRLQEEIKQLRQQIDNQATTIREMRNPPDPNQRYAKKPADPFDMETLFKAGREMVANLRSFFPKDPT